MKRHILGASAAIMMLATACQPETEREQLGIPENALLVKTESMSSADGSKTSVSGETVRWVSGDVVKLYGTNPRSQVLTEDGTVTNNNGQVYINPQSGLFANAVRGRKLMAYYECAESNPRTTTPTITLPASYEAEYRGSSTTIALPMMAYEPSFGTTLNFRHLTAAVKVTLWNDIGSKIYVDSVVVSSSTQLLCGPMQLDLNADGFGVAPGTATGTSGKRVTVKLTPTLQVDNNRLISLQVPIRPINAGPLTIEVFARREQNFSNVAGGVPSTRMETTFFHYSHTNTAPAMARNQMISAKIALRRAANTTSGATMTETIHDNTLFSVSDTKKVRFSKGNLIYVRDNAQWKFADNQYDFVARFGGAANVDLFGWGTGQNPTEDSYNVRYGPTSGDLTGANADYDWACNPIVNGGNTAHQWRTLTKDEWEYLLSGRPNAAAKLGYATVNEVEGVVFLPDYWVCPANLSFTPGASDYTVNVYTTDQWTQMQAAGAIFLPTVGQGYFSYNMGYYSLEYIRGRFYYWTSSRTDGAAYGLTDFSMITCNVRNHFPVRPVRDAN